MKEADAEGEAGSYLTSWGDVSLRLPSGSTGPLNIFIINQPFTVVNSSFNCSQLDPEEPYLPLLSLKQVESKTPEQMEGAEGSLDFSPTASVSGGHHRLLRPPHQPS